MWVKYIRLQQLCIQYLLHRQNATMRFVTNRIYLPKMGCDSSLIDNFVSPILRYQLDAKTALCSVYVQLLVNEVKQPHEPRNHVYVGWLTNVTPTKMV